MLKVHISKNKRQYVLLPTGRAQFIKATTLKAVPVPKKLVKKIVKKPKVKKIVMKPKVKKTKAKSKLAGIFKSKI